MCRSADHLARWMVDDIVSQEPKAERSLMHRFNIALVWTTQHPLLVQLKQPAPFNVMHSCVASGEDMEGLVVHE